jgi:type II secretory pathway pseudopilin PulG
MRRDKTVNSGRQSSICDFRFAISDFQSRIRNLQSQIPNPQSPIPNPSSSPRRGITLVELLVVLVILMIMASATIPRLRPMSDRARTREAARSVQLYVNSARNLAMTTGRTCGVMIERLPTVHDSDNCELCSMTLTQVETPPPYAGDSLASVGTVTLKPPPDNFNYYVTFAYSTSVDGSLSGIVHQYDLIQFNFQGPWYTITSNPATGNGSLSAQVARSQVQNVPWTANASSPLPYKIMRQPVKSAAAALQLPAPAVIDLTCSGPDPLPGVTCAPGNMTGYTSSAGVAPYWAPNPSSGAWAAPITIMFAPNGSVVQCYENVTLGPGNNPVAASTATQPFYLLIGKIDQVAYTGLQPDPPTKNCADQTNLWVAINPATGLVVTAEMDSLSDPSLTAMEQQLISGQSQDEQQVIAGRHFARQSDAMGGK